MKKTQSKHQVPMPDAESNEPATRDKLIAAAARCMISEGPNVSSRAIAREADMNLALINYYFGTKEELVRAAFSSLANPINEDRMKRLEVCRITAQSSRISMREIAEAFILPYFAAPGGIEAGRAVAWISLASRHFPTEFARSLITEHFDAIATSTIELLRYADPSMSEDEACQKYFFLSGTVLAALTGSQPNGRLDQLTALSGLETPLAPEDLRSSLVDFVVLGLGVSGPIKSEFLG